MEINLSSKQFNKLFPFHILIDKELRIKGVGKSMDKICHLPYHSSFYSLFDFKRPHLEEQTFDALKNLVAAFIADRVELVAAWRRMAITSCQPQRWVRTETHQRRQRQIDCRCLGRWGRWRFR